MQQPIKRRHPRNTPKDILLNIQKTNKHKNLYTFNPTSSINNTSYHYKQQAIDQSLNPEHQIYNKQDQKVYYDLEKQSSDLELINKETNTNNFYSNIGNERNLRNLQDKYETDNGNVAKKEQVVQNNSQFSQYQLSNKLASGIIKKQKFYSNNSDINPQFIIKNQSNTQQKSQKQHNKKKQTSPQRQFNRLALSLMGIKRTKFNKTCLDTKSSFSIRQVANKKINQIQYESKGQNRYQSKQQDGQSQIYKHSLYPFSARKIENIKQEINKISGQSRMRRNYSKYQNQQKQEQINENYQHQNQQISQTNKPISYHQILQNKRSSALLTITIKTCLATLKNLLNQSLKSKQIQIKVPQFFLKPPSQLSAFSSFSSFNSQTLTNQSIHLFSSLDIPIVSINIRKYSNCIVIINHNICIIWHQGQSGKKYIGSWKNKYFDEGQKQGLGLQWAPGKYVYYGQFKSNKRNGFGVMKMNDRNIIIGYWRNGKHLQFGIGKNIGH